MSAMDDAMTALRTAVNAAITQARADAAGQQEAADAASVTAFAAEIALPSQAEGPAPQ